MIDTFRCDDKDTLVAYLYGEIDTDRRRDVDSHLRTCASCAQEVDELQGVRRDLASWQPPELQLDFTIAQKPATVLRPSRWSLPSLPAWAQVAAAMLVCATGVSIANLQVRYGQDGLSVTTGWMAPNAAPVTSAPALQQAAAPAPVEDWRPALTALEADLRRELQMVRSTTAGPVVARSEQPVETGVVLRRVEAMIADSEHRQRQELAARLMQVGRDFDHQRRSDLMKINQGFTQLQGRTGEVAESQREMFNLLRRVNTQVP